MDMNANDGIAANREYKDRLFTFIFGKEENRPVPQQRLERHQLY